MWVMPDEGLTFETSVFEILCGGQFTFWTRLIKCKTPQRRSTTVSLETYIPIIYLCWLLFFDSFVCFQLLAPDHNLTVADKLAKQVDETYIQKDEDKEEKEDEAKKATGRKQKNEKKFLPAVKWALVYRALKPLLRPCGDLGEGRLDFYHRSISKAVRRKWV